MPEIIHIMLYLLCVSDCIVWTMTTKLIHAWLGAFITNIFYSLNTVRWLYRCRGLVIWLFPLDRWGRGYEEVRTVGFARTHSACVVCALTSQGIWWVWFFPSHCVKQFIQRTPCGLGDQKIDRPWGEFATLWNFVNTVSDLSQGIRRLHLYLITKAKVKIGFRRNKNTSTHKWRIKEAVPLNINSEEGGGGTRL